MNIAQVGCSVNPCIGGMGRALFNHAKVLSEAGHDVAVYTLPPLPDDCAALSSLKGEGDFKIYIIDFLFNAGKAAWGAKFIPSLEFYDIVHLHLPFFGVADTLAAWKRYISQKNNHTSNILHPTSKMVATYHMDPVGIGLKRKYFQWWYKHRFKNVIDACDAIAVTSKAYARESKFVRLVDIDRCEEILLRVDTEKFNPSLDFPKNSGRYFLEKYVLFVGALDNAHYFKGISVLLRALANTEDVQLIIVGDGDLRGFYEHQAKQLGVENRVKFVGRVGDNDLARWYAGARALVLSSIDRSEAFGIVLIEAMACGTPVITSDLPGVRTVVRRVDGGDFVRPGNQKELSSALQKAWNEPWSKDDRHALAQRAQDVYGLSTLADQLIDWYKSAKSNL